MADSTINAALSAYNNAAKALGTGGMEARDTEGPSFSELLQNIKTDAVQTGKNDEKQSMLAAAGQANVSDVVTAVSAAEVTLQAVTAVRDRVISAYQEIMRMPI